MEKNTFDYQKCSVITFQFHNWCRIDI